MPLRLRFLLLMLIFLALPLRGLAASGWFACPHAAVAAEAHAEHGHHAAHEAAAAAEADDSAAPGAGCNACSPCCAAALPQAEAPAPSAPERQQALVTYRPQAPPAPLPQPFERPPRPLLA